MVLTLNLVASKSRAVNILGLKIRLLLEQWAIEITLLWMVMLKSGTAMILSPKTRLSHTYTN